MVVGHGNGWRVHLVDWEPSSTWNPGGGGIYGGGDIFGGGDINNGTHGDINGGIFGDVWGGNENIQYTPFVTTFSYAYWATETRQIQNPAEEQSPASKPMGAGTQQTQAESGPGKWVTTDLDKKGARNFFQIILNRTETIGDKGRLWGSDGKDFKGTVQDVTQEWRALSTSEVENLRKNGYISVDKTYGETRVIRQTFLKGRDPWQQSGKSWYWQPVVRNEEFELLKLK